MRSSQVDVDGILRALKQTRFFHTTQFILICASVIVASTNSFFYVFFAITPEYRCNSLTEFQLSQYNISINEVSLIYDTCSIDIINNDGRVTAVNRTVDCLNGYYYATPVDKSIVSQWDLVCDSVGLAESTQMVFTFGQMVSGLLAPCLIEKFGRKPLRVSSHIFMLVLNLIAAYSPSYWLFTATRFLIGAIREVFMLSSITLVCELYSKERRIIMSSGFMFIWGMYTTSLGLIAYMLKDYGWNALFLVSVVISGYVLVDFFFLEESLRWLFANSKIKEAKKIIKKAAKQNKVDFDNVWSITLKDVSKEEAANLVNETSLECQSNESKAPIDITTAQSDSEKEISIFTRLLTFFKSPYLRRVTIVISIEIAVSATSWNGLVQMVEVLAGSIYLNYSVMSLVEALSIGIYAVIAKRFGHKKALHIMKTIATLSLMSISLLHIFADSSKTKEYIILIMYIIAVTGISVTSCGDMIYTSELYPTHVRSIGSGFATAFMRIVAMAAPFLKLLALVAPWAPGIIIGISCIVSSILLQVFLPETANRVLTQTIEDVKMTENKNKRKKINI